MTLKTRPHDSARYLDTPEAREEYLAAAQETGDSAVIERAIAVLERARGDGERRQP